MDSQEEVEFTEPPPPERGFHTIEAPPTNCRFDEVAKGFFVNVNYSVALPVEPPVETPTTL